MDGIVNKREENEETSSEENSKLQLSSPELFETENSDVKIPNLQKASSARDLREHHEKESVVPTSKSEVRKMITTSVSPKILAADIEKSNKVPNLQKTASVQDIRDDVSEIDSVVLRPKSEKRRVLSTSLSPLRKTNSSQDFRNSGFKNGHKKPDGMVLKLVIPANSPTPSPVETNYLTVNSYNDFTGNGNLNDRHKHQTYSINSHQDYTPQLNGGGHINHGYSLYDHTDYPSPHRGSSVPVTPAPSTHKPDNPTPPEEKKRAFSNTLVNTFSILYAILNVTVGLALYVADLIDGTNPTAEIFSLVLVAIACLYISFLIIDISIYTGKRRKYEKLVEKSIPENIDVTEMPDGNFQFDIVLSEMLKIRKSIKHDYCFNKDRHSTNFYLKVGAAAFCFGHLVHSGLTIAYLLVNLLSDDNNCASIPVLILDFVYPFYSFVILFFIFKYSNIIINRHATLARFGIMHCLSSSICFWVWTIMREVLEGIASKTSGYYDDSTEVPSERLQSNSGVDVVSESIDLSPRRFTAVCEYSNDSMVAVFKEISPYLYPFSVEYSILTVGVLFLVWQNIEKCEARNEEEASTSECRNPPENLEKTESNIVLHADCQASNKGLLGGFMIMLLTIISTIVFFVTVFVDSGIQQDGGLLFHKITSLIILGLSLLACLLGYCQITKLDLNAAHHNLMDDILLFICIPAFFLNGVFSIIPAIMSADVLMIVDLVLEIIQVLVQTTFILDGLRRSSNTKKLRKLKPGRELVTFLVVANVAMWIKETFTVKAHGLEDDRYEYYGKELWTVLGHLCLPLIMFYRFHSSVCFGDIWKYAYEPSGH